MLDQNPDLEDIEKGRDLYIAAKRERRDFRGEVYKSYESHLMALMSALWELETDLSENLDDVPDFFKDREASLLVTMAAALPAKVLSYEGIISSTNCKDMSDRLELAQSLMEGALQAL